MLGEMLRLCHNIPLASHRNVSWDDYPWLRRSHDDHHRIVEAIRLHDGPRAEGLMREHIHSVKLRMQSRLLADGDAPVSGTSAPTDWLHPKALQPERKDA